MDFLYAYEVNLPMTFVGHRERGGFTLVRLEKDFSAYIFCLCRDSSIDNENSGESPLISIWGEYTGLCSVIYGLADICCTNLTSIKNYISSYLVIDSQEGSLPVVTDTKVPWSDEETLQLLDIWGKDSMQRALKGCLKNRHIFTQIAQKMAEKGYMRTVEQCQTRIKRLKKYFRQNHK